MKITHKLWLFSYRFRLDEDGIPRASRYFATVRRDISMPESFNRSTNFDQITVYFLLLDQLIFVVAFNHRC